MPKKFRTYMVVTNICVDDFNDEATMMMQVEQDLSKAAQNPDLFDEWEEENVEEKNATSRALVLAAHAEDLYRKLKILLDEAETNDKFGHCVSELRALTAAGELLAEIERDLKNASHSE